MHSSKAWYQRAWVWILVVVVIVGAWFITDYNKLATGQQGVYQQESQVQNVLQRRGDVLPELVGAVKGSQKQEKSVYGRIADDRTEYYNANTKYKNAKSPQAKAQALNTQNGAINAIVGSIKEAYPHLSSNSNMNKLMVEIEGSNNRVSVERRNLNEDINGYNDIAVRFPGSIVASMTNHHPIQQFHASSSAQKAPKIDFGK